MRRDIQIYKTSRLEWQRRARKERELQPASITKTVKRQHEQARLQFGRGSGVNAALRSRLAGATLMYGDHSAVS